MFNRMGKHCKPKRVSSFTSFFKLILRFGEQARSRLEVYAVEELVDPRLEMRYSEKEIICMIQTASLCIRRDPQLRPRMSQVKQIKHNLETCSFLSQTLSLRYTVVFVWLLKVLRLLEGDMVVNERFSGRLSIERIVR